MKKIRLFLFLISMLSVAALINSFYFPTGQASKEVRGIIDSDIIWSKSNSPYILTAPLSVKNGITLTIEPGVTINLNSYYIQVNGTLVAKGTSANLIQFKGDGAIKFTEASKSWNGQSGVGCIIENANVSLVYIQ